MPTYKYRREDGTTFTIRQKITEDPLAACPETGQAVERVITGGMGFQLKGGGWYKDGYASSDAANGNGTAPDSSNPTEGADSTAKESSSEPSEKSESKVAESV